MMGMVSRQDSTNRCHRCTDGSITTDVESGEMFCSKCGLVFVERAESYGPEKQARISDNKDNNSRTGPPTSPIMYDGGLSTVIGSTNRDSSGRVITLSMKSNIKRLRVLDGRSPVDKRTAGPLKYGLLEIKRLKDKLAVSDAVMKRAAYLFRKAVEINMDPWTIPWCACGSNNVTSLAGKPTRSGISTIWRGHPM